jgi:maltooligosyltrehalose synthase
MVSDWPDGRIKLYISTIGMRLRRRRPGLFIDGSYRPFDVVGAAADHVIAFERAHDGDALVVVAPRLTTGLDPTGGLPLGEAAWRDTSLQLGHAAVQTYDDLVTGARLTGGGTLRVGTVLEACPVALLWRGRAD